MRTLSEIQADLESWYRRYSQGLAGPFIAATDDVRDLVSALREAMKYAGHNYWSCASLRIKTDEHGFDTGRRDPCDCGFDALSERVKP